jgi:tRNA dimethylallyltransferase
LHCDIECCCAIPELFAFGFCTHIIECKKHDPRRSADIDRHNPVRLIRAIEIATALGRVPHADKQANLYDVLTIGLAPDAVTLKKRIHTRLQARLKAGMLREAKRLHIQGLSYKRMEALGLEYRFMARYLQGKCTKKEMFDQLEQEINRYAKRQFTWFKRNETTHWLTADALPAAISLVKNFLR